MSSAFRLFLIVFLVSAPDAALAHRPYLVGDGEVRLRTQTLHVEYWHGDGIFSPDPAAILLMDGARNIYAQTPVGQFPGKICLWRTCYFYVNHFFPWIDLYRLPETDLAIVRAYEEEYPEGAPGILAGFVPSRAYHIYPLVFLKTIVDQSGVIFLQTLPLLLLYLAGKAVLRMKNRLYKGMVMAVAGLLAILGSPALLAFGMFLMVNFAIFPHFVFVSVIMWLLMRSLKRRKKTDFPL